MSDSRSKKYWSRWAAGLLALGVGCSPNLESPEQEAAGQVEQGVATEQRTVSWVAQTGSNKCPFGDTANGNLAAQNQLATARTEERVTISSLAGRRITSIRLSNSASGFMYDDVTLLAYNNHLLMASDVRVARYSNGGVTPGTSPVPYAWSSIRSNFIDNEEAQPTWCASGATTCQVPKTETSGAVNVEIPNFKALDEAAYPTAPDTRTFNLVTIGDNDPATDCNHGALSLTLTITSEPVSSCTSGGGTVSQPLRADDPILGYWNSRSGYATTLPQSGSSSVSMSPMTTCPWPVGSPLWRNIRYSSCAPGVRIYTGERNVRPSACVDDWRPATFTLRVDSSGTQSLTENIPSHFNFTHTWYRN